LVTPEQLIKLGLITKEQAKEALEKKKQNPNKSFLDILYELGYISKEEYLKILAFDLKVPYVTELKNVRLRDIKVPANILKQFRAIPFEIKYNKVKIALVNPLDYNARNYFQRIYRNAQIEFYLAHEEDINKVLQLIENRQQIQQIISDIKKELRGEAITGEESAIMRLIDFILRGAIKKKASDIHIEADEDGALIRIRIFGTLYEFLDLESEIFNAISSRIKLEAGMDVSEKRKPQDGAFSREIDGNHFDFRVSTLPTVWGESIVIRILDKRNITKSLDESGISPKNLELLKKAISYPNGIFLVTGPTGSGKSTTLYATINEVTGVDKKVITVEDPVEYKLRGIQQVSVNERAGLTFASALKAILRQDPDIIMIGEIRDMETLEIAIKAALTGHLVLSTLHTNDAVGAVSRMIDMGAEPFMVGAALVGVEAQRLVKTICPHCKAEHKPPEAFLEPIRSILPKDAKFYMGRGCEKCNMTGYAGRTPITEIFIKDDKLEAMIAKNKDKVELMEYLKNEKGFKPMFYDGLLKALKGITTLEEVYKVARP